MSFPPFLLFKVLILSRRSFSVAIVWIPIPAYILICIYPYLRFPTQGFISNDNSSCTQIIRPDPASKLSLVTQGKSLHKVPHTHKNRRGLEGTCVISLPHSSSCEDIFAYISAAIVHVSFWHPVVDFKPRFMKCFDSMTATIL